MSLKADKDTVRIEVHIDGKLAGVFKAGFAELSVDVSNLPPGEHRVGIVGYDRCLNDRALSDTIHRS